MASSSALELAAIVPASLPVPTEADQRLRELPAFDAADVSREVGFVRAVKRFVAFPLAVLGVLAVLGAVTTGEIALAVGASAITVLLQLTLHDDVRLAYALDLVRRGDLTRARRSLQRLALARGRRSEERQRACVVLAALAYRGAELERAVQWTRAAAELERARVGSDAHHRFLVLASEVLVLAQSGATDDACARLCELPAAPAGDELAALWRVHVALLCAFVADRVEQVEGELDGWAPLVRRVDSVGATAALLGWAFAAAGRHDVAAHWCEHALVHGDASVLRTRYPAVMSALDAFVRAGHYARR